MQARYPRSNLPLMQATIPTATPSANGAPQIDMAANRQQILQNTEGRAQQLANDPYNQSVMNYLQGVVGGQNVPYSDTVKNSILAQQGAGSAAAEEAQMAALRDSLGASGGSIYDPGYQAAQRQAMSARQAQNLDAMGQLNAKAGVENANFQMRGANNLANARNAQNAQQNQMLENANRFRENDRAQVPAQPAATTMMQPQRPNWYNQSRPGGGGGSVVHVGSWI